MRTPSMSLIVLVPAERPPVMSKVPAPWVVVMISGPAVPETRIMSVSASPSRILLPPRPSIRSSPLPPLIESLSDPPMSVSLTVPPMRVAGPVAPEALSKSLPSPPSRVSAVGSPAKVDFVLAVAGVDSDARQQTRAASVVQVDLVIAHPGVDRQHHLVAELHGLEVVHHDQAVAGRAGRVVDGVVRRRGDDAQVGGRHQVEHWRQILEEYSLTATKTGDEACALAQIGPHAVNITGLLGSAGQRQIVKTNAAIIVDAVGKAQQAIRAVDRQTIVTAKTIERDLRQAFKEAGILPVAIDKYFDEIGVGG